MQASDAIASDFFRAKKYIGSNERKMISEIVFSYLRTISLSDYFLKTYYPQQNIADSVSNEKVFISTVLASKFKPSPLIYIDNYLSKINKDFVSLDLELEIAFNDIFASSEIDFKSFLHISNSFCEELEVKYNSDEKLHPDLYCLQEHLICSLSKIYSIKQINQLALSLLYSAPVCIRVNNFLINTDEAKLQLENSNIETISTSISPSGLILKKRINLSENELYKSGLIEVQDIGSQLISFALAPEQKSFILDACAGAGGKTLHLALLTHNNAEITATDIEFKRLKEIPHRASKAGITSIQTIHQKKSNQLHLLTKVKFDFILIDAPCSGMGTVRRMPMPKWRLTEKLIQKLRKNQLDILNYYSKFLKPGGELIYATCSLLPEENQEVIIDFLKGNIEFEPQPLMPAFSQYGIEINSLNNDDFMLYLTPSNHNSDGFFMAKIRKIED
jgi:16S rRNA (cytosine967-C5)-methyltransferase